MEKENQAKGLTLSMDNDTVPSKLICKLSSLLRG
jgi:hypothetical protein